MRRSFVGVVAAGAGILALGVPGSALACVNPDIAIGGGSSGGPGETVGFSISNTDRDASYTIDFGGTKFTGTDDTAEPGLQGSIKVPDLGDEASTVSVSASFDHEGETYASKLSTFSYTGRPQPTSPPPDPSASVPQAPPAQSTPASASPGAGNSPSFDGDGPAGGDRGSAQTAGSEIAGAGSSHASSGGSAAGISAGAAQSLGSAEPPVAQADAELASPSTRAAQRAGEPAKQDAPGDAGAGRSVVPLTTQAASSPRSQDAPDTTVRDVSTAEDVSSGALPVILLAALIALATMLIFAMRRIGPDETGVGAAGSRWTPPSLSAEANWRSMLIEAELQEMIAEGRARELLGAGTKSEAVGPPPADRASGPLRAFAMAHEAPPNPLATHDPKVENGT